MARLGRGTSTSSKVVRPFRRQDAEHGLGVFATSSTFPPLTVTSPSVAFTLPVFATTSQFPTFTIEYDTQFALGVFATTSSFPEIAPDVPILPGQFLTGHYPIEWARTVFGVAPYYVISVEGWDDLPEIDSGNAVRSARHGSWPGRDFAQSRTVSAVIAISDSAEGFGGARRDLRRILNVSEDGSQLDLVIRTDSETLKTKAKINGRVLPTESYGQGFTAVAVRWVCADPRRYDLQQQSVTITPGGAEFLVNDGDIATNPIIKINGPVVDPVITNDTLERILRFNITLADGKQLIVDTDAGTVTLDGDDRMDTLSSLSVPVEEWVIPAGTSRISYATTSGSAHIELLFASAYL